MSLAFLLNLCQLPNTFDPFRLVTSVNGIVEFLSLLGTARLIRVEVHIVVSLDEALARIRLGTGVGQVVVVVLDVGALVRRDAVRLTQAAVLRPNRVARIPRGALGPYLRTNLVLQVAQALLQVLVLLQFFTLLFVQRSL